MSEEFRKSGSEGPENETPAPEAASEKKKGGFIGEFFSGAAKGAKSVGEGISAGIKVISEKKPAKKAPAETSAAPVPEEIAEEPMEEIPAAPVPEEIAEEPAEEIPAAPAVETPTETFEVAPSADEEEEAAMPEEDFSGDETSFPEDENKESFLSGIIRKLNSLPTAAVIGGAAAILALLIIIILSVASCSPADDTPSANNPSQGEVTVDPVSPEDGEVPPAEDGEVVLPSRKDRFAEAFNANNDVVAWLYIPGLEDVDAGVCFSYDKSYPYDKRDITGKSVPNSYWIDGAYYTHFRSIFGSTTEELSYNTVIFGHSDLGKENLSYKNDDPTGPLFSQLFSFKDPSFAEKTPYIYLTLPEEDSVWEIFAVFYNDANAVNSTFSSFYKKNGGSLWYIEPNPSEPEFQLMLDTAKSRSIYDYNVEVTSDDRILTLSTCTVAYGLNARSNYRFVIMAKLVDEPSPDYAEKLASFRINEDAPVPDTYKKDFENYIKKWKPSED